MPCSVKRSRSCQPDARERSDAKDTFSSRDDFLDPQPSPQLVADVIFCSSLSTYRMTWKAVVLRNDAKMTHCELEEPSLSGAAGLSMPALGILIGRCKLQRRRRVRAAGRHVRQAAYMKLTSYFNCYQSSPWPSEGPSARLYQIAFEPSVDEPRGLPSLRAKTHRSIDPKCALSLVVVIFHQG